MIKLIAADLDGTLLDDSHALPPRTAEMISDLERTGKIFAAASGRQYYSVKKLFDNIGVSDKMIFMAENGGAIYYHDRPICSEALPADDVLNFIELLEKMPDVRVLLSGEKAAYIKKGSISREFGFNADLYCERLKETDDLRAAVLADRIIKIAVFDPCAETGCYPVLKKYSDDFGVMLSNVQWVDIVGKTVNKGSGLKRIADHLGISADECMAFGDYLNDLEMIEFARFGYAMENAHPALKAAAYGIAPPNSRFGVISVVYDKVLSDKRDG